MNVACFCFPAQNEGMLDADRMLVNSKAWLKEDFNGICKCSLIWSGGGEEEALVNVTICLEGLADVAAFYWLMSMVENNP
jgi:hypothetical protein